MKKLRKRIKTEFTCFYCGDKVGKPLGYMHEGEVRPFHKSCFYKWKQKIDDEKLKNETNKEDVDNSYE